MQRGCPIESVRVAASAYPNYSDCVPIAASESLYEVLPDSMTKDHILSFATLLRKLNMVDITP